MRPFTHCLLALALLSGACVLLSNNRRSSTAATPPAQPKLTIFGGAPLSIPNHDPHIQYDLDQNSEKFFVRLPSDFDRGQHHGLIVFMNSADAMTVPAGWEQILDQRHLVYIAPQDAGNDQQVSRRLGLALLAAAKASEQYPIDSARVYAAGFSGGARIASTIAFYHPDIFRGTIQCCGSNFPGPIERHFAPADNDTEHYGSMDATPDQLNLARANVRFALITGSQDFRCNYLRDIYENVFQKNNFQATFLDIPNMTHQICDGLTLEKALHFIEER